MVIFAQLVLALLGVCMPIVVPAMLWRLLRISRGESRPWLELDPPAELFCDGCHRLVPAEADPQSKTRVSSPFRTAAAGGTEGPIGPCATHDVAGLGRGCSGSLYALTHPVAREGLSALDERRVRGNTWRCAGLFIGAWLCTWSGLGPMAQHPGSLGLALTAVALIVWGFRPRRLRPSWWMGVGRCP